MHKDISDQQLFEALKRLERLADLTDSRFRIPFTNIRFGLDAIIGLIPFVGDAISLVISLHLLFEASKLGVPFSLKLKMLGNIILDCLVGLIPILGDAADVVFKANNRNMKLLLEHINQDYERRKLILEPNKERKFVRLAFIVVSVLIVSMSIYAITKWV